LMSSASKNEDKRPHSVFVTTAPARVEMECNAPRKGLGLQNGAGRCLSTRSRAISESYRDPIPDQAAIPRFYRLPTIPALHRFVEMPGSSEKPHQLGTGQGRDGAVAETGSRSFFGFFKRTDITFDTKDAREYRLGTAFDSPHFGERAIVETFEELLYRYFYHPESKSLGPDGEPCQPKTRGRLLRPHIIGGKRDRI